MDAESPPAPTPQDVEAAFRCLEYCLEAFEPVVRLRDFPEGGEQVGNHLHAEEALGFIRRVLANQAALAQPPAPQQGDVEAARQFAAHYSYLSRATVVEMEYKVLGLLQTTRAQARAETVREFTRAMLAGSRSLGRGDGDGVGSVILPRRS